MSTDAPRILISRLSAMGDTILTLPVACALRQQFPGAYLIWVVEEKSSGVVRGHECLDEVVILSRGWFTSWSGIMDARERLRKLRVDVSIDCQGLTKSALAGWLSGAPTRIGYRGAHACELSPLLNNVRVKPRLAHLTDRSLELLSPLGVHDPTVRWKFPLCAAARQRAAEISRRMGLANGYIVINPGATWDSKLWSTRYFGIVSRYVGETHGLPTLVVWGNEREHRMAREVVGASGSHGIVAPATDLSELAAVIQRARLCICCDTGPLHMSVAVGTPSIALHGVTRPAESGPYGEPHVAIQAQYVGGTRRQRRRCDNRAMLQIKPRMVFDACDRLLRQKPVPRSSAA